MANGWGGARPNSGRPKKVDPWALAEGERVSLLKYCQETGCDPVVAMINMAIDPDTSPEMAFACDREVAKYIHPIPARVNVKHSGRVEGDLSNKSLDGLWEMADSLRRRRTGAYVEADAPG